MKSTRLTIWALLLLLAGTLLLPVARTFAGGETSRPHPTRGGAFRRPVVTIPLRHLHGTQDLAFHDAILLPGGGVEFTRIEYLVSNFRVRPAGGEWITFDNQFFDINPPDRTCSLRIVGVPEQPIDEFGFSIGLAPEINHGDPAQYSTGHPLSPIENSLYWTWAQGYVFFAAEGHYWQNNERHAFLYHIGGDDKLMNVTLAMPAGVTNLADIEIRFDASRIWNGTETISFADGGAVTHSAEGDTLATRMARNIESAFSIAKNGAPTTPDKPGEAISAAPAPTKATPYRFSLRGNFPPPTFPADNPLTNEGVALGAKLFYEGLLSRDGSISCSSCHDPSLAYSDNKPRSTGMMGRKGRRNAQPLINLAWRKGFFWDGRAATLRDQVFHPIRDVKEMAFSPEEAAARLAAEPQYQSLFAKAFDGQEATTTTLALALEQFLLVQISQDSKFDRSERGEDTFTEEEKRGFQLFFTEFDPARGIIGADCFHCHGNVLFTNERYANTGLDERSLDDGRRDATGEYWDAARFKVPTLRNVELTAPYMHDGRFATLEEVVDHYDHGIQESETLDVSIAKHNGPMNLPEADKKALVAFMKTLTDKSFVERAVIARDEARGGNPVE